MADQEQNPAPGETPSGIPPKQVLIKKPDAPLAESPTLRRPVLRRPGSEAPGVPVAPEIKPGVPTSPLKRETSRIPLPSAVATAEPAAPPAGTSTIADLKTVRVKPLSAPQPGSGLPAGLKGTSDLQAQASKSKTSRISLEAALGALPDAGQAPAGPKTIRLKRPAELASPKATSPLPLAVPLSSGSTGPVVPVAVPIGGASSQTARLPTSKLATARLSEVEADNGDTATSLTRRKTIKVRRPSSAATPVVTVRAGGAAAGEAEAADDTRPWVAPAGSVPVVVVDRAHWFFVFSAVASIIVTFALIGVLASQAWGPNESLTEFSSWLKGPDMPLPGSYLAR